MNCPSFVDYIPYFATAGTTTPHIVEGVGEVAMLADLPAITVNYRHTPHPDNAWHGLTLPNGATVTRYTPCTKTTHGNIAYTTK